MTIIESVNVIPMNKETIFDEPYREEETFGCLFDYNEWDRIMSEENQIYYEGVMEEVPEKEEIAKKFKGFITTPVAKYGKNVLLAKTKVFNSLAEIMDNDFSNCFLCVIWPCKHEAGVSYKIRYAEIE